ncbi:MAG TPA: cysteine--tRNA ligase, partial [Nitrososphaerales archaeon]|nr:cysteine--tRNA ligase [Nitrososphaerales archaeon]
MLKLYNTLGHSVQEFKPIHVKAVKMYTCGPTVWNYAHIGNMRTYVFEDVLRKYLKFKGFKVTQVMNITDVEDKIIKGIVQTGKNRAELTKFYEDALMDDLATLGVEKVEHYPHATEHIEEMVKMIEVLISKGYAYKAEDGSVYYDVTRFKSYGALSGVKLDELKPTSRVASDYYEEKREANDFALWKAWVPEDREVFWETSLGKGRPGWHIECSAMSIKYLGEHFDIHTGGVDHRFPHHENEIAQSEAATGKKFVNYWIHAEFLNFEGKDMHKSLGNVVYLKDLTGSGWDPLTVRLFLISAHYRVRLDLTDDAMGQARSQRRRLQEFVERLKAIKGGKKEKSELEEELMSGFVRAMDNDLNVPEALAAIFGVVKSGNSQLDSGSLKPNEAASLLAALEDVNGVLGIFDFGSQTISKEME